MKVGILKDIKVGEYRVIATPAEVAVLVSDGHEVKVQKGAGERAQLMAWILGIFIYFSDSFSPLFVGSTMRSITDNAKISREKLAYIADSTRKKMRLFCF